MLDFFVSFGYIGMFISALLAASVFPLSSEAVLLTLLALGFDPFLLFVVSSSGNVLGAVFSFWVGRQGRIDWIEKYLHVKKESLDRAERFMAGKGSWIGLVSFIPVVGVGITVMLGLMRANPVISLISIAIGKTARYFVLVYGPLLVMWLYRTYM